MHDDSPGAIHDTDVELGTLIDGRHASPELGRKHEFSSSKTLPDRLPVEADHECVPLAKP